VALAQIKDYFTQKGLILGWKNNLVLFFGTSQNCPDARRLPTSAPNFSENDVTLWKVWFWILGQNVVAPFFSSHSLILW
jgi:hypothetical protein